MKFNIWQVALFTAIILGASWLVFPGPRTLISIYIQDSKGQLAQALLDKMLAMNPDDPDLNVEAAELAQASGEVEKSLELLGKVMQLRPGRAELVLKMADWLDGADRPLEAVAQMEAALMLMPKPSERQPETVTNMRNVLLRLLDHYTYQGDAQAMHQTVQRLIPLDAIILAPTAAKHYALQLVSREMDSLAAAVAKGNDPVAKAVLIDTYAIRRGYLDDLAEGQLGPEQDKSFIGDILDQFVRVGMTAEAVRIAEALDLRNKATAARLSVATALSNYRADKDAQQVMAALLKEHPDNVEILVAMASMAMGAETPELAVRHLQRVVQFAPSDVGAKWSLGEALLAAKRPVEAYDVLRALPVGDVRQANLLLDAAGETHSLDAVTIAAKAVQALAEGEPLVGAKLAEAWLDVKRPREAWAIMRKIAEDSGGDPALIRKAVEAASQTNDPGTIREVLALIERADGQDHTLLLDIAEMLVGNSELFGAAKLYERHLARNPGDRITALKLAQVHYWRSAPDQAFAVVERLLKVAPGDKELRRLAAVYAEGAGKNSEAFHLYAEIYRDNPKSKTARADYLRLAEWSGNNAASAILLAEDSDQDPGNAQKASRAGESFLWSDQPRKALPYLERALALKPDDLPLRRMLAGALGGLGLVDRQAAALEPLAARGFLTQDEAVVLAQHSLDRKLPQKALSLLTRYEGMKPLPWEAGAQLVRAYTQLNRQESAQQLMRRLKGDYAADAVRLASIGDLAVQFKRMDFALECYAAALRIDPRNRVALKGQAQIYAWNNDAERAIRGFENYRVQHPSDIEARYQLGELYHSTDRAGEASGEYKKTLNLIRQARRTKAAGATSQESVTQ